MKILDKNAEAVLDFWFKEHSSDDWFSYNPDFDNKIKVRFYDLHLRAILGELYPWRVSPHGALAEIIILDQFSRNIYRNDIRSYLSDDAALVLAQSFVKQKFDDDLFVSEKLFAYIPYMHSESLIIQKESLELYKNLGDEKYLEFAQRHHDVIARFGRFPHRNKILNKPSTTQEIAFLKENPLGF